MDAKLLKGINHALVDLRNKKNESIEVIKLNEDPNYFEGQRDAYQDSINLLERLLEDYNKRLEKINDKK